MKANTLLCVLMTSVMCVELSGDDWVPSDYAVMDDEPVIPETPLTVFLESFNGPEDVGALNSMFELNDATPSAALFGLIRSEKCWNGQVDCSGLINACNDHGAFITPTTDLADIECFFKYWVSHRNRNISPFSRLEVQYTLYRLVAVLAAGALNAFDFDELEAMKLAFRYETLPPTEEDMCFYFTIEKVGNKFSVLEFLLLSNLPIYPCMLKVRTKRVRVTRE